MNFLIIGGLLVVGIAAIVAVVLLVLGEQRAEKSRTTHTAVAASPLVPNTMAAAAPLLEERRSQPARNSAAYTPSRPLTSAPAAPVAREATPRLRNEDFGHATLNGQFNELAAELRTLHQEAMDLERRLRNLTDLVAQLQDSTSDGFGLEEDATAHPAFDSASM